MEELGKNFYSFLEHQGRNFQSPSPSVFFVKYTGSKQRASAKIIADFLRYENLSIAGTSFFYNGDILLCCNLDEFRYSYLKLYYGDSVLDHMANVVYKLIDEHPSAFSCETCVVNVKAQEESLVISYYSVDITSHSARIRRSMGGFVGAPLINLGDMIRAEFEITNPSGKFAQDYFQDHVILKFLESQAPSIGHTP